ncbi:MAG: hypothetical protein JXM70_07870 [Pirellulales bacterium]|nr:hypothetical protein [Pirellulales bacterium]
MNRKLILLSVVAITLMGFGVSHGDLIMVDDLAVFKGDGFENDTVGTSPSSTGVGAWVDGADAYVKNELFPGAAEGFNYAALSASGGTALLNATFSGASPGAVIISKWSLYISDADTATRASAGHPYQAGYTTEVNKDWYPKAKNAWGMLFPESVNSQYIDVTGIGSDEVAVYYLGELSADGWGNVTVGGQNMYIKVGMWHSVEMNYTEDTPTFTISIDGVVSDPLLAAPLGGTYWTNTGPTVALIHSTKADGGTFMTYIDAPVPEPATFTLLVIGMFCLCMLKRKHK